MLKIYRLKYDVIGIGMFWNINLSNYLFEKNHCSLFIAKSRIVHPDSVLTFRSVDFGNGINLHKLLRGNNINYEIFKI